MCRAGSRYEPVEEILSSPALNVKYKIKVCWNYSWLFGFLKLKFRAGSFSNEETRRPFPVFLIFSFFIILQQKEYKAFRKHLPYFKGNSKCFAWLQQLKSFSFFFLNISIESVTLVHAQLQKWDLQTREGEKEGGMRSTLGELRGDGTLKVRGQKRRKTGSHNRERQRERQL